MVVNILSVSCIPFSLTLNTALFSQIHYITNLQNKPT